MDLFYAVEMGSDHGVQILISALKSNKAAKLTSL
jgi:hypothetical protein